MSLRLHADASVEATQTAQWYEQQRPGLGVEFLTALSDAYQAIQANPLKYPRADEAPPEVEFRSYALRRFPHVVHYHVGLNLILVLAVAHTSRSPGYWLRRFS